MIVETLKVFVHVIEQKNFTRAAELLHLSQPAVSLQIQNLESEFGTKLVHRSSKLVKPTEAGEILYERAKKILHLYEEAKQEVDLLHNTVKGALKIGASFTIGEYVLPRVLAEYATQYPHVEIEVKIANTDEITQAVRANQIDVALIEGEIDAEIHVEPFMSDEMVLIVPPNHPVLKQKNVSIDHLQDQIWIFRESGSGTRKYSDHFIQEFGLRVKRSFVFSSSQGVKEAVAAGLGIALVSRWIVRKELQTGDIATLQVKDYRFFRQFSILLQQNPAMTKAMEVFLQKIRSYEKVFQA